jgi:hypothetical protein
VLGDDSDGIEELPGELESLPEDMESGADDFDGLPEGIEEGLDEFESLPEEFEEGTDDFEVLPEYIEETDFDADGLDSSFEDELLPDVPGGFDEPDLAQDSMDSWLDSDAVPEAETPAMPSADKPGRKDNKEKPKAGVDPFGEEAARLYRYLKDLSLSLPPDKKQAMEASGVSAKLDAIIEHSAGGKPPEAVPGEICGVPVSPRLAKLIEYMRREKQHGGK